MDLVQDGGGKRLLRIDNSHLFDPITVALGFYIGLPAMLTDRFDVPQKRQTPRITPLSVATPRIVRAIEAKRPRTIESWDEIGADEYARSFTAARTAGSDIVADLYDGFMETLDEQGGESDYVKRVMPILKAKGWLPELDDEQLGNRVRLIYDTNIRTAQAVGKWRMAQRTKHALPYFRQSTVGDRRVRPGHAMLEGILRPVDDPIWNQIYAPCGFRCRCQTVQLTRSQAARYGGMTSETEARERVEAALATGDLWGYNVGVVADQVQAQAVEAANERRIPGAPPVTSSPMQGSTVWRALFIDKIADLLEDLLK